MSLEQFIHEVYGDKDITLLELAVASQLYFEDVEEQHTQAIDGMEDTQELVLA